MSKFAVISIQFLIILYTYSFSADKPDGFASVSGKGLATTTGGEGGTTVTVTTWSDLKKFAEAGEKHIILVKGTIQAPSLGAAVLVKSDKTIVGFGDNATIFKGEFTLLNVSNIIIRNLTIQGSKYSGENDYDGIQADNSHHIWIDHCLFSENGDGHIDLRKVCDYVTVSWCILNNHNKAFGIGWTTETDFRTTIHHCWIDKTNQRNPSFDMGIGHLYNNYLNEVTSYGNYARGKARLVIENSVFEKVNRPIYVDAGATCYISGLQFINCTGSQTGNVSTMPFDPKSSYNYTLTPTSEVKTVVMSGAGPKASIGEQYTGSSSIAKHLDAQYSNLNKARISDFVRLEGNWIRVADNLSGDAVTVSIYNLNGGLVHRIINGESLDLGKVKMKGKYILDVTSKSAHFTKSFIANQ